MCSQPWINKSVVKSGESWLAVSAAASLANKANEAKE